MKNKLAIIGAGGHGKVVADAASKMRKYTSIIFLDDDGNLTECNGFPIEGKSSESVNYLNDCDFFVAIGNAFTREKIQGWLQDMGASISTIIHPEAVIGRNVMIGYGTVMMAGVVINSGSIIGRGCIINTCSSVDHDCRIENFAHVAVGAHVAGNVDVGERTWIGAGATVSNNVCICHDCMIGAGTVVIKDIKETGTYVGVPAKKNTNIDFGGY